MPPRTEGDAPGFINLPAGLEDALRSSGLSDYRDFFTGTSGAAEKLGLTGEQAEMFKKFAMPFQQKRFTDLLSSLKPYEERETGFIDKQYDIGSQNLQNQFTQGRTGLAQRLMSGTTGAMQQSARSGFAGSGAAQSGLLQLRDATQSTYSGMAGKMASGMSSLGLGRDRSMAALQDQIGARKGQAYGLLGDYLSNVMGLGREFLSYSPAGSGGTGGTGGAGGSGIPSTQTTVADAGTGDQSGAMGGFQSGGTGADMGDTGDPSGQTGLGDTVSGYTDHGQSMDDTQLTGDEYDDYIEDQKTDADRLTALTGQRQPGATETSAEEAARRKANAEKDTIKDTVGLDETGSKFEGQTSLSDRLNQSSGGSPLGAPKPKTQYAPNWRQNIATSAELTGDVGDTGKDTNESGDRDPGFVPSPVPPSDREPGFQIPNDSLAAAVTPSNQNTDPGDDVSIVPNDADQDVPFGDDTGNASVNEQLNNPYEDDNSGSISPSDDVEEDEGSPPLLPGIVSGSPSLPGFAGQQSQFTGLLNPGRSGGGFNSQSMQEQIARALTSYKPSKALRG